LSRAFRWVTRLQTESPTAAGAQTCVDLLAPYSSVVDNLKGHTVTRILLTLTATPDAINEIGQVFYGIAIVNADAAAASAFPDADIESDNVRWLLRDYMDTRMTNLNDGSQKETRTYDLRAQALLRSDQEEVHLILDRTGVGGMLHSMLSRVLLRMP